MNLLILLAFATPVHAEEKPRVTIESTEAEFAREYDRLMQATDRLIIRTEKKGKTDAKKDNDRTE